MLELHTLGESRIDVAGARIGPAAPHLFGALLYVGMESGRRVPRAQLQALLFPTSDARAASHSLRQLLYRIRRAGIGLDSDATTVSLPRERVITDFQPFLAPADRSASDLARLSGGFLPGFSAAFSRPFADWLDLRRDELLSQIRRTLTTELAAQRAAGRWTRAEATARALLSLDPLNEEATLTLAEARALGGAKVEAVKLLDGYLREVGPSDRALRLPAAVLRRRIAERLPDAAQLPGSRFVGRTEPLTLLRDLLDRARGGEGTACHVWGEAGIGKTRLLAEFTRRAILGGARVEQVASQPHDVRRPMGAFSDLVPALLRLPGALGCSPEAIAFLRKLFELDGDPTRGLSPDVREAELLSANITRAISDLLDAVTTEATQVVVVEDAQWLDPMSLRVFADLIAERKRRRLVLLFTSRERRAKALGAHADRVRSVRLAPLSTGESAALLGDLLDRAGVEAERELIDWCLRTGGGNPFFLHSLAAHYATTRDREHIPEPLGALLGERLALLDDRALHVFEAASVLGRHSTFDNLTAVLGLSNYDLLLALRSLEEMGFIVSAGSTVSSAHALLSEIALQRAPLSVRRLLNRNTARLLARVAESGAPAAVLWDCAEHWLQADDPAHAVAALRACARHALEIGHPGDAVRALRRAIELPLETGDRVAVRRELLTAAEIAADWPTIFQTLDAIRSQLIADGQPAELEPDLELLSVEAWISTAHDPREVVGGLRRRAFDEASTGRQRLRACRLLISLGEALYLPELAADAIEAASRVGADESSTVERLFFEMMYQSSFGDLDAAVAPARRLIALAGSQPHAPMRCRMLVFGGAGLIRAGHLDEGCDAARAGYEAATASRLRTWQQRAATLIATMLREDERLEEALVWHERSRAAFEHVDGRENCVDFYSNCVKFAIEIGNYAEAREWLRRLGVDAPRARVGGAGLHFRALELRVRQLAESYDCPESELADIRDVHVQHRGVHQHDEVVEALWHALDRKGRRDEGDALVREYFARYRRLRFPMGRGLREVVEGAERRAAAGAGV